LVLLEAEREAREREEEEGMTVVDKIGTATDQLAIVAGELAADVGTVMTWLEDDLKRIVKNTHRDESEDGEMAETPRPMPTTVPLVSYAAAATHPNRPDQVAALARAAARK
jgi:hypothetical protein